MGEPARPGRRYSDEEVRRLLERAADLQRLGPAVSWQESGGLTLADVEEVAAEAGIDRSLVRRAALELDAPRLSGASERFFGAPFVLELERIVTGEMAALFDLVPEIEAAAEARGDASLVGRTLTWRFTTPQRERTLRVVVRSAGGETRIAVEERLGALAGSLFGGIVGGAGGGIGLGVGLGVGIGVLASIPFALVFPVAVIGGSWLGTRALYRHLVGRRRRALGELLERVAAAVESRAARGLASGEGRGLS